MASHQNYAYQAYQSPAQPYAGRSDELHIDDYDVPHSAAHYPSPGPLSTDPPPPPAHRVPLMSTAHPPPGPGAGPGAGPGPYGPQNYSDFSPPQSTPHITPGADNMGEGSAGGGINGIATGVASTHERESGVQALRDVENWSRNGAAGPPRTSPPNTTATPFADQYGYEHPAPPRPAHAQLPYTAGSLAPASVGASSSSQRSLNMDGRPSPPESIAMYQDSPYNRYSTSNLNLAPHALGAINPLDTDDDDDWGMGPQPRTSTQQKRRSFVPFVGSRDGSQEDTPSASGAAIAGAGAVAGAGAAAAGPTAYAAPATGTGYNAVPGGAGGGGLSELQTEKSQWAAAEKHRRKRNTWIIVIIVVIVCIGAIVGGIAGTQIHKGGGSEKEKAEEQAKEAAAAVEADNKDDLSIKSAEIKEIMGNKDLHKVFPGIDYTPLNAQYPDCEHVPPSQNNITRDVAVMSRLTNSIRLYGTDCNQTEMVLHAIDRLELKNMKVWIGVWIGNNDTTNERQINQMHKLLADYDADRFKGVIVGNEVLFREDLTQAELLDVVKEVRDDLDSKKMDLPIAIADLGDNWTADMASKVDVVMSNVHPFFAGVTAEKAADWTMSFWESHDVALTANDPSIKHLIAEVGWPTKGGNDCGGRDCTTKTEGSVASIDNLNKFMEDWVCPALKNGTDYFWFEAFDEPWKIQFNTDGKEWEDQWGLMDVNRKLKPGVKIPDCGSLNLQ